MQYTSNVYFSYPHIKPYCHLRCSCVSGIWITLEIFLWTDSWKLNLIH